MRESDTLSLLLEHWHLAAARHLVQSAKALDSALNGGMDYRKQSERLAEDARTFLSIADAEKGVRRIRQSVDAIEDIMSDLRNSEAHITEMTDPYDADAGGFHVN